MTAVAVTCTRCDEPFEAERPADYETNPYVRRFWAMHLLCPVCVPLIEEESRQAELELEHEQQTERRERFARLSGVPAEYQGLTWRDLPDLAPEAIQAAQEWSTGPRKGLFVSGSTGRGKTWLVAAAVWVMLERQPVRWCNVSHLSTHLLRPFDDPQYTAAVDVLTGKTALVLDDIDKVGPKAAPHIFAAIDSRVSEGVPLAITTNLRLGELEAKFPGCGEQIVSRIVKHCRGAILALSGPDLRLRQVA